MVSLDRVISSLVYASVALGVVLLLVANGLVPGWLFLSLVGGVVAYFVCAIAVARHVKGAYYAALALAFVTLAVSLPQPEHYAFIQAGEIVPSVIFALGSILQICLIVSILAWAVSARRAARA